MTKKEIAALQAQVVALQTELARAQALRWITAEETPDIPVPTGWNETTAGWVFGTDKVHPACSSIITHQVGARNVQEFEARTRGSHSQRGIPLFSTAARAWAALRRAKEREFARELAAIDAGLAAALASEPRNGP